MNNIATYRSNIIHLNAQEAKFRSVQVRGNLTVDGCINVGGETKNRIDELENKINDLDIIINKQQKIIEALWYNPGPGGPGASEASESFAVHSEALTLYK